MSSFRLRSEPLAASKERSARALFRIERAVFASIENTTCPPPSWPCPCAQEARKIVPNAMERNAKILIFWRIKLS